MIKPIDWPRLLGDIAYMLGEPMRHSDVRIPVGRRKLAEEVGFPDEKVRRWLDGAYPRHHDGEALIEHWCLLTGKAREFAPVDRFPSLSAHAVKRSERV